MTTEVGRKAYLKKIKKQLLLFQSSLWHIAMAPGWESEVPGFGPGGPTGNL